jgi:thiol-disulfide isomerase/thioredoxin
VRRQRLSLQPVTPVGGVGGWGPERRSPGGARTRYSSACEHVKQKMIFASALLLASSLLGVPQASAEQSRATAAEAAVVEYLKANLKPGEPVEVSKLLKEVFTEPLERKALSRLFNSFFKLPLFIAQSQKAKGMPPSLLEISEQFAFAVPGEADLLLRIVEVDPRVPRFFERDPKTGEITRVYIDRIVEDPDFGKTLDRTIHGWEGTPAPAFSVKTFAGTDLSLEKMSGKPFLLYFWFSNCSPCVATSPRLVELDRVYSPKGFTILGLNADSLLELDVTDAARAAYVAKLGIRFTEAHANEEIQKAYGGVSIFPTLFFVNRAGVIVRHLVSGQDTAALEDAIQLALK